MATIKGRIKAISVSAKKGTRKVNVPQARLLADFGIIGDAHSGSRHRQVSMLPVESINKMAAKGVKVSPGDFAENITTEGIDLLTLSEGGRLKVGENAELEITQFGKKCHDKCEIFERVGDCIMPREGVFARVTKEGAINVGDVIEAIDDND